MGYKWIQQKRSGKVHLCNEHGMSYCQVEDNTNKKLAFSDKQPNGRKVCGLCLSLKSGDGSKRQTLRDEVYEVLDMLAECFDVPFFKHEKIGVWARDRRRGHDVHT